jgi:hypothetical protein
MRWRFLLVTGILIAACPSLLPAAKTDKGRTRVITRSGYDAAARVVELFEGIGHETLDARLIPRSALEGSVFVENRSDKAITVILPPPVAAVQVLKQGFGRAGAGGRGGVAQAAAWHLSDSMSWKSLAEKRIEELGGINPQPYFSTEELAAAREAVAAARLAAVERKGAAASEPGPTRARERPRDRARIFRRPQQYE